jgi:hypothetical protein
MKRLPRDLVPDKLPNPVFLADRDPILKAIKIQLERLSKTFEYDAERLSVGQAASRAMVRIGAYYSVFISYAELVNMPQNLVDIFTDTLADYESAYHTILYGSAQERASAIKYLEEQL